MLFLKSVESNTAAALRRGISIFPCLTIVFSSTFIMSISVKCGSAISPDVFGTSERKAPMYTEILLYNY